MRTTKDTPTYSHYFAPAGRKLINFGTVHGFPVIINSVFNSSLLLWVAPLNREMLRIILIIQLLCFQKHLRCAWKERKVTNGSVRGGGGRSLSVSVCLSVCLCCLTHMSKHTNIYSLTRCTHTHTLRARAHGHTYTHMHTHSQEDQAVYGLCVLSQPGNCTDAGTALNASGLLTYSTPNLLSY